MWARVRYGASWPLPGTVGGGKLPDASGQGKPETMSGERRDKSATREREAARQQRLSQALRDNLRRRKAQRRARDTDDGEPSGSGKDEPEAD